MKTEGIITESKKYVKLDNGETYPISKYQKNHELSEGQKVVVKIDTEYPESCDSFCEGDETCIICLCNNKVAVLEL
jgi:guanylate kinase